MSDTLFPSGRERLRTGVRMRGRTGFLGWSIGGAGAPPMLHPGMQASMPKQRQAQHLWELRTVLPMLYAGMQASMLGA
ncbi:hypothetical protein KDH_64590 [Dictyobacter sp. S3.2.2.5]|uniref:Uncharacterized protein n=1 Tax=Dictyobacter halimunensis TaxID=3026934 RepID=A0ABQ6G157_9CHLR|nr:hypothetical protein KDH_64590 [Dictyobacter sp. S3.2.2.5]